MLHQMRTQLGTVPTLLWCVRQMNPASPKSFPEAMYAAFSVATVAEGFTLTSNRPAVLRMNTRIVVLWGLELSVA